MANARQLNAETLDGAIRDYARIFAMPTEWSPNENGSSPIPGDDNRHARNGEAWVIQSLYNASFADEFEHLKAGIENELGQTSLQRFRKMASAHFSPRSADVLEQELAERLAIMPDGTHIEGAKGRVQMGNRLVGLRPKRVFAPGYIREVKRWMHRTLAREGGIDWARAPEPRYEVVARKMYWPIYAGEEEERAAGRVGKGTVIDELPRDGEAVMALAPAISNEAAIAAVDAVADRLDEGSTAAVIRGRTGSQPADVDATETGTLLFTLTMSDPAFNGASDDDPGAIASADTITDDSSADATNTLTYCRAAAAGTSADDHVDGSAGTSSVNFVFNTASIVSGANISMTSFTLRIPETPGG